MTSSAHPDGRGCLTFEFWEIGGRLSGWAGTVRGGFFVAFISMLTGFLVALVLLFDAAQQQNILLKQPGELSSSTATGSGSYRHIEGFVIHTSNARKTRRKPREEKERFPSLLFFSGHFHQKPVQFSSSLQVHSQEHPLPSQHPFSPCHIQCTQSRSASTCAATRNAFENTTRAIN